MTTTDTTRVVINIVITLVATRRHLSLRTCFLSAFSFPSMTQTPSLQISLPASTAISGVPSAGQNANKPFA